MASSDSRNPHSITTSNQISKVADMTEPDNTIPLSPQWLLPKPGENKAGMALGENHPSPCAGYGNLTDVIKSPGNGEDMHENQKKKDVFRPTFLDMESGRRDLWRDEERDTNPSIRRDRRREGDKGIGESRKTDRWIDNSSTRHFGEAHRAPAERWTDPSREANYDQRRDSKWNTRWGPDDKDLDKWTSAGKYGDMPHDKGLLHLANHGKDEREGDHYRPWRPSSLQGRGRVEPSHHQIQMTNKEALTFGHGRGRGENASSIFSIGRGRSNFGAGNISNLSAYSQSSGFVSDRGDNGYGEPSPFRYSRTKLLDIFRMTDVRFSNKILDGWTQVPSLTQEEPLEPLALCAPTPEESAILKGIDKGDIVSSGAPQISKDGSTARNSNDFAQSRRARIGSRDDASLLPHDVNDKVDHVKLAHSKVLEVLPHEKQVYAYESNVNTDGTDNRQMHTENKCSVEAARDAAAALKKGDEVCNYRDSNTKEGLYAHSGAPWRSSSVGEPEHTPTRDWFDVPSDIRLRSSDVSWSQAPKDHSNEWGNVLPDPSYAHSELKWKVGEDSIVRNHPAVVVDNELESRKLLHPSPEDLLLYYKDPQGQVQGPFSGSDIIGWFEAGYFGIDLQVRLANAPKDSPFSLLGDVMPHLHSKAKPPPGFNTAKQNEVTDLSSRSNLSGFGQVFPFPFGSDVIGNEHRQTHGSSTEAEKRFLESLMSGDISSSLERFAPAQGHQGFMGHISSGLPSMGAESGDAVNLLAKKMNLERQKSLSNPYPYWPPRDGVPVVPGADIIRDPNMPQANLLSSIADVPRQSHTQNVEMMSLLQGLSDRSSAGVNNGLGGWPNFPVQGSVDPFKDKMDLHNFPQTVYGMQQHKLQPQNQPSITNLLAQTLDSPSVVSDKLLSSGFVQDPQVLNLLQQQYLLQLQSQQSVLGPQLSLLDKMLLLKQQQKQEEQQQLLRQQQQLLSQVLSEQQLIQRVGDLSFGQVQASAPLAGNVPDDHSAPQLSHQLLQVNSQVPVSGLLDDQNASISNIPPKVSQHLSQTVASEGSSLHLPHQMFGVPQKPFPSMPPHIENNKNSSSSLGLEIMENLPAPEELGKSQSDAALEHSNSEFSLLPSTGQALKSDTKSVLPGSVADRGVSADCVPFELPESSACKSSVSTREVEVLMPERTNAEVLPTDAFEETPVKVCNEEVSASKEAKNIEPCAVKKNSDKKSRKVKSSKAQTPSDHVKGASKAATVQKSKQSEAEGALVAVKSEVSVAAGGKLHETPVEKVREVSYSKEIGLSLPNKLPGFASESVEDKGEQKQCDSTGQQSEQVSSAQRAWKPAVCVKPKSLLEIQQEEQRRVQMEIPVPSISASVSPMTSSTPWAGVVVHPEPKAFREIHQDSCSAEHDMGKSELAESKKSGLHDLLAAEVLAKSNDKKIEVSDNASSLPPLPAKSSQLDIVDDDNFIEAKDTKKSRKKAAKAKGAGVKVSATVSSAEVTVTSSPAEKGKSVKHVQAEKEVLPAPPSGPSLGDFVPWKGESTSPSPALAWTTDPGKFPKPTSLRDILREQEKKVTTALQHPQMSAPRKSQSAQTRAGSWSVSASSPSKATSPIPVHAHVSSQSKNKGEDDLFWGPPDQSKQETKQVQFPQLGNQGSWATKSTPVKGTPGPSLSGQKSAGGRDMEHYFSTSPASAQISMKGKQDGSAKHSEAMDFRDWCESESIRLTGSKDTSFLEFCLKQSRSEAETLLIENLGSFDPNHEFIEKFLNYMELLPADVLEIAFQIRNDLKAYNGRATDMTSDNAGFGDTDKDSGVGVDGSAKGGKKKGKKGKKVSPSVLGFNVVSNRIMMGEIQTVED